MAWTDERLEERFDGIDRRFDAIDRRLDRLAEEMVALRGEMLAIHRLLSRSGVGFAIAFLGMLVAVVARGG